jgi:hypothetical protein
MRLSIIGLAIANISDSDIFSQFIVYPLGSWHSVKLGL